MRKTSVLITLLLCFVLFQNFTSAPGTHKVIGRIDSVSSAADGSTVISGWTCDSGKSNSINAHLYIGGAAGAGGVYVKSITAALRSEPAVGKACNDVTNSPHRFKFEMPYEFSEKYAGQKIYVHGISVSGGRNLFIGRSGEFVVPKPHSQIVGFIDGIILNPQKNGYLIRGWACQAGAEQSVSVHAYFGLPAGQGVVAKMAIADLASTSAIAEKCQTTLKKHTFSIPLSLREYNRYAGQKLYVYGISTLAGGANRQLARSGLHAPNEPSFDEVSCENWDGVVDRNIRLAAGCAFKGQVLFKGPDHTLDCNNASISNNDTVVSGTIGQGIGLYPAKSACESAAIATDVAYQYFEDPRVDGSVVKNCNVSGFKFGVYFRRQVWIKSKVSGSCVLLGEFNSADSRKGTFIDVDFYLGGRNKRSAFNPSFITLRNVNVSNSKTDGIFVNEYATNWLIEQSSAIGNSVGLYLERESVGTKIYNSVIKDNRHVGIAIDASAKNMIDRNVIDHNGYAGISLYKNCGEANGVPRYLHANHNVIKRNSIKNHSSGFGLTTLTTNYLKSSDINRAGVGIWIASRQSMTSESILKAYPNATKACVDSPVMVSGSEVYKDYSAHNIIQQNDMSDNRLANIIVEDDNNSIQNNKFFTTGSISTYADVILGPVNGSIISENISTSQNIKGSVFHFGE